MCEFGCKFGSAAARILLAQIFVIAVIITVSQILSHPEAYDAYYAKMNAYGLPGIFAPLTILIQFVFGFALFLGYKTRASSLVLAVYAIFVALFMKLQEVNGLILTLQYLAIAGGLLLLALNPKTACSLDNLKNKSLE